MSYFIRMTFIFVKIFVILIFFSQMVALSFCCDVITFIFVLFSNQCSYDFQTCYTHDLKNIFRFMILINFTALRKHVHALCRNS